VDRPMPNPRSLAPGAMATAPGRRRRQALLLCALVSTAVCADTARASACARHGPSPSCAEADVAGDFEVDEAAAMEVQLLQQSLAVDRAPRSSTDMAVEIASSAEASWRGGAAVSGVELVSSPPATAPASHTPSVAHHAAPAAHRMAPAKAAKAAKAADGHRSHARGSLASMVALKMSAEEAEFRKLHAQPGGGWAPTINYLVLLIFTVLLCSFIGFAIQAWRADVPAAPLPAEAKLETDCWGFCPCLVTPEPDPEDLESWEVSGREACLCCPSCIPCPRDLGPRQWTWRLAEVNLWIQIINAARQVWVSMLMPEFLLKDLQCSFAILMLIASVPVVLSLRSRSTGPLLNYFFCSLITQGLYAAAKYAAFSSVVTACALNQDDFRGCKPEGILAECLPKNGCLQDVLIQAACQAPGADTCAYFTQVGNSNLLISDAFGVMFFLLGTVPIFMAATAKQKRTSFGAR